MTRPELIQFMDEHGWSLLQDDHDHVMFTRQEGCRFPRSTMLRLLALAGIEDPTPPRYATALYIYLPLA